MFSPDTVSVVSGGLSTCARLPELHITRNQRTTWQQRRNESFTSFHMADHYIYYKKLRLEMSSINRDTANTDLHSTHIMQPSLDQDMDIENELCKTLL